MGKLCIGLTAVLGIVIYGAACVSPPASEAGDDFLVQQKIVEFDANHYLGLDGYYSVQGLRQQQQQEEKLDKIIEILEKLVDLHVNDSDPVDPTDPTDPVDPTDPTDPTDPVDPNGPTALDQAAYDIFVTKCAQCHTGDNSRAGFALLGELEDGTVTLYDLPVSERVLVYDIVADIALRERGKNRMPKGGGRLLETEIETLRLWMIEKAEKVYNNNGN